MNREEIEQKVNEVLADTLGIQQDVIKSDSKFFEDLGGDSIDFVEVIIAIEDELDITIDDAQARNCVTVNDFYNLVEQS